MQNNYDILGVSHSATKAEIKKAYHKLSLLHHPDRPNGSHDKFLKIKEAYEALTSFNPANTHNIFTGRPRETYMVVNGTTYNHRTKEIHIDVAFSRNILKASTVAVKGVNHTWILMGMNGGTLVISPEFLKTNGFTFDIYFLCSNGKTIVKSFEFDDPRSTKSKLKDKYLDANFLIRSLFKAILFIVIYYILYNIIF